VAKHIVPNTPHYTIRLTELEYQQHMELIYFGSLMSQLFQRASFINPLSDHQTGGHVHFEDALLSMLDFIHRGQRYAKRWDTLGEAWVKVYEQAGLNRTE